MVSLILAMLPLTLTSASVYNSYMGLTDSNPISSGVVTILANEQNVNSYHIDTSKNDDVSYITNDEGAEYWEFTFNLGSSIFQFDIGCESSTYAGESNRHSYTFSCWSNYQYETNFYLTNLTAVRVTNANVYVSLPNVLFYTSEYIQSESRYYYGGSYDNDTEWFYDAYSTSIYSFYLTFDLVVLPPSLFDYTLTYNNGYNTGYNDGFDYGYDYGYDEGHTSGYTEGASEQATTSYDEGYDIGYQQGVNDSNQYTFFNLFGAIADTPILIVRNLLDFDLFGVSVINAVLSLFTALILIYIFRKLF